jgi:hypothetical protein
LRSYGSGLEAYFAGNAGAAEPAFAAATVADPTDARYWYFLGLSKLAQGKSAAADFRKGAELESRGLPGRRTIGADLERVQGSARAAIDAVRP